MTETQSEYYRDWYERRMADPAYREERARANRERYAQQPRPVSKRRQAFVEQCERVCALLAEAARNGEETPSLHEMAAKLRIGFAAARNSFRTLLAAGRISKLDRGPDFRVGILGTGLATAFPGGRRERRWEASAKVTGAAYERETPIREPERPSPFAGFTFEDDPRAVRDTGSQGMPRRPDRMTYAGNGSAWAA